MEERGTRTRLTTDPRADFAPHWGPGDESIFFAMPTVAYDLFKVPAQGGEPAAVKVDGYDKIIDDISQDGSLIAYSNDDAGNKSIWFLELDGDGYSARPFLDREFNEWYSSFSPDGRYIAYSSDESNRTEIYVRPIAGGGWRLQVSVDGGRNPLWRGNEVFFLQGDGFYAATVTVEPNPRADRPELLFSGRYTQGVTSHNYDVSSDGQRFFVTKVPIDLRPTRLNVILNWFEELERKVAEGQL